MTTTTNAVANRWMDQALDAMRKAGEKISKGCDSDASRDLDAAIEALALARVSVDGVSEKTRSRFIRGIRKALGYTTP